MRSRWHETTIRHLLAKNGGEVKTGPFGTKLKASEYSDIGVPVVSVGEIQMGRIVVSDRTPKVDVDVTNRMPEYLLCEGDIVFGRKGAVERSAIVRAEQAGWFLGSDGIRLRITPTCNAQFLAYQFLSQAHRRWMLQHAGGTTMASLNQKIIEHIPIVLPPLPEQKVIVHILGSLDDKIELNRQMNDTLESMAQALFKSWFVDFDPVIDNTLTAGNPIPEPLQTKAEARRGLGGKCKQLPKDIQQKFPNSFVFTKEIGWIPEDWRVTSFGKVSSCFDNMRVPLSKQQRKEKQPGIIPYHGATSVMDFIDEWIFDDIYLLIGEDGSVLKEDGSPFIQYIWGKTWVNNHAHVLQGVKDISTEHLMLFMGCQNMRAYVTGAVQLKINQKNLNRIPFLKASEEINYEFASIIAPYFEKFRLNAEEIRTLSNLRDTLLPKLLSGQLRLPDSLIEKFAEQPNISDIEQLISEAS